jgi:hypothetical protein
MSWHRRLVGFPICGVAFGEHAASVEVTYVDNRGLVRTAAAVVLVEILSLCAQFRFGHPGQWSVLLAG